jgi:hypothetical protein
MSMKLAGGAGVLGVVCGSIGGLTADMFDFPATGATAAQIVAFNEEHRTALLVSMLFNTTAVTLWLVFGAGVWLRLRQAAGGDGLPAACFAFGFVAFVTLLFAGFVPAFLLAYRGAEVTEPRLLYDAAFGLLAMSGAPTALALGAYAAFVFKAGQFPRWTAELAVLGAAAHIALFASFLVEDGFFSLQGEVIIAIPATLFLWIIGTGIAMLAAPDGSGARVHSYGTKTP